MAKSSTTLSLAFILERFSRLQNAVKQWENDESPESNIKLGMSVYKVVSDKLRKEIELFLDGTADQNKEVDVEARLVVLAIDTFALAYQKFDHECSVAITPARTDQLWTALNRIAEASSQKFVSNKPRSVASLFSDGVTFTQIAAIYGWKLEDGTDDGAKVAEELEAPGTHYDPSTWVNPAFKSRLKIIEKDWSLRPSRRSAAYARPEEEKPNPDWVPPSIKMMILAGAPAEQIANVHGISVIDAQDQINAAEEAKNALSDETSRKQEMTTSTSEQLAGV